MYYSFTCWQGDFKTLKFDVKIFFFVWWQLLKTVVKTLWKKLVNKILLILNWIIWISVFSSSLHYLCHYSFLVSSCWNQLSVRSFTHSACRVYPSLPLFFILFMSLNFCPSFCPHFFLSFVLYFILSCVFPTFCLCAFFTQLCSFIHILFLSCSPFPPVFPYDLFLPFLLFSPFWSMFLHLFDLSSHLLLFFVFNLKYS